MNLQENSFRISNVSVKTGSGLSRNTFVERYRYINRHSMYSVSRSLVVFYVHVTVHSDSSSVYHQGFIHHTLSNGISHAGL